MGNHLVADLSYTRFKNYDNFLMYQTPQRFESIGLPSESPWQVFDEK